MTDRGINGSTRENLRQVIVTWLFGAAWMYIASGATLTRYAKLLNATNFGFGILATIPFIGAIAQLPASLLIEKYGNRRGVFLWCATIHRLLWLVIAALPWICPAPMRWKSLLILMLVSSVLANVAHPAWMAWMADLIPSRIRGRFFSRRMQYGQAIGLVLSVLAGAAMDWPDPGAGLILRNVISVLFTVAGIAGVIDILLYLRVPDNDHAKSFRRPASFRGIVRDALGNRDFRRFLGYSFTMTFATGFMGQFAWLYLFDEIGMSNARANAMLVSIPLLASMLGYPVWGRMVDRFGSKATLLIAGLMVVNGGASWVLVTRETWVAGYMLALCAAFAWAGMDIACFNLLLGMTGIRAGRRAGNSAVIAINSVVVAIGGALSGLFGGTIAEYLGNTWRSSLFGWPITYHGVLFLCSSGLRVIALAWLLSLRETRAGSATRDVLRFMVTNVYSNLMQATFFPARVIVNLARSTYKVVRKGAIGGDRGDG